MMKKTILLVLLIISIVYDINSLTGIKVISDFEGGNGMLIYSNFEKNSVHIKSILKNNDTLNINLYVKISGFSIDKPLNIYVNSSFTPAVCAYSYDKINWYRIRINDKKIYTKKFLYNEIFFASNFPYLYSDLTNFIAKISKNSFIESGILSYSEAGRKVYYLRITDKNVSDEGKQLIWVTARQHAFEHNQNFIIEGFLNYLISEEQTVEKMLKKSIIYVVPMVDVDGCATGATGKNRKPVDFNRCWNQNPSYFKAVEAIKQLIEKTSKKNRFRIFWDSHCMGWNPKKKIYGFYFLNIYPPGSRNFKNLIRLNEYFKKYQGYDLYIDDFIGSGRDLRIGISYIKKAYPKLDISFVTENYFDCMPDGQKWTIEHYRKAGINLCKAIIDYILN